MIRFYFDEHMRRKVRDAVEARGHEAIMATDVGMRQKDDDTEHLPYATENGMVMVTFDRPFAGRTMSRTDHAGLICLSESIRYDIGAQIRALVEFAENHTPESVEGRVFWLR
jgi:predicted nuclease of predicted toxin-antitoxin system